MLVKKAAETVVPEIYALTLMEWQLSCLRHANELQPELAYQVAALDVLQLPLLHNQVHELRSGEIIRAELSHAVIHLRNGLIINLFMGLALAKEVLAGIEYITDVEAQLLYPIGSNLNHNQLRCSGGSLQYQTSP